VSKRKNEDRARRRRERRKDKRREARREQQRESSSSTLTPFREQDFPVDPPDLQRCFPAVHLDPSLRRIPDPLALLGLDPRAPHTADEIRSAWRAQIERHPPEREPERARELTAARDRLLAPERVLERRLGTLHAPDPRAYGLPVGPTEPTKSSTKATSRARLLGQLVLYALLEEELADRNPSTGPRQDALPF
jgi:hypothetical protein